jgi:hypothetical protein
MKILWRWNMSLDDLLEPEVLVVAGVTAALMSPTVRGYLHQGIVYGLAGVLTLGDKIKDTARGVSDRARNLATGKHGAGSEAAPETEPVAG